MLIKKTYVWIFCLIIAKCLCHSQLAYAVSPDDVVGFWLTENGKGVIEVFSDVDKKYSGKIVWIKDIHLKIIDDKKDIHNPDKKMQSRSLLNLKNLEGFHFDGSKWVDGTIYDPEKGKTYSAKMTLEDKDTLNLRGFIGISLFGRTSTWKRQTQIIPDEYLKKN